MPQPSILSPRSRRRTLRRLAPALTCLLLLLNVPARGQQAEPADPERGGHHPGVEQMEMLVVARVFQVGGQ